MAPVYSPCLLMSENQGPLERDSWMMKIGRVPEIQSVSSGLVRQEFLARSRWPHNTIKMLLSDNLKAPSKTNLRMEVGFSSRGVIIWS